MDQRISQNYEVMMEVDPTRELPELYLKILGFKTCDVCEDADHKGKECPMVNQERIDTLYSMLPEQNTLDDIAQITNQLQDEFKRVVQSREARNMEHENYLLPFEQEAVEKVRERMQAIQDSASS